MHGINNNVKSKQMVILFKPRKSQVVVVVVQKGIYCWVLLLLLGYVFNFSEKLITIFVYVDVASVTFCRPYTVSRFRPVEI